MRVVVAVVASGFTLAACSALPSLDFLKSSPSTAALRFESKPPGAEVKASGQSCRTPCELTVEVSPDLAATFALKGYQSQTISVRSESGVFSSPQWIPNPVQAELQRAAPAKKRKLVASPAPSSAPPSSPKATAPTNTQ
jgi:hypothetical protein